MSPRRPLGSVIPRTRHGRGLPLRSSAPRRLVRFVSGVAGVMVLLLPAGQATADDDPGPVDWPTIEQPDAGGNGSDPGPVKWTTIVQPENNDPASDPQPVDWPSPQPG